MNQVGDLLIDTQVSRMDEKPQRFEATIPEAWRAISAYGGVALTVAHRAAQHAVNRNSLVPVYVSAVFAAPVPCGRVEIDTGILSNSMHAVSANATLYANGDSRPKVHVSAVFGHRGKSPFRLMEARFPEDILMPSEAIPSSGHGLGMMPILDQFELRWAHDFPARPGRKGSEGAITESEPAVTSAWLRFYRSPCTSDGTIDALTLSVPADALASAIFRGLGTRSAPFVPVTLAMDLHIFRTTRSEWLLQHARVVELSDGYASGIVEIWDEGRNLLAWGTQLRFCKRRR